LLELYHGATNNNIYQLSKGCDALQFIIQDRTAWTQPEQKQQHIKAKAAKAANINITPHTT